MAEIKNNIITQGMSGKLGNLIVFRNKGGKTFVATAPSKPSGERTEVQKAHRKRFQEAAVYGQGVVADPDKKAGYETAGKKKGLSAYNVAVADFLKAPDILEINVSNYTGAVGDTIVVIVKDNFKVETVTVDIANADGSEVESGAATPDASRTIWTYTAKAANASLAGDKITIRAYDVPGNVGEEVSSL